MKPLVAFRTASFVFFCFLIAPPVFAENGKFDWNKSFSVPAYLHQAKEASAAVAAPAAAPAQDLAPSIDRLSKKCQEFVKNLPESFQWGLLDVPEDRTAAERKSISIFYFGRFLPGKTPVLFLNGGPGGNSVAPYKNFEAAQKNLPESEQIPFIYMDQRGAGCSEEYPTESDLATARELLNYSSRAIVEDAESLRKRLLGGKRWIIYGASYGGNIVSRYIILHPEALAAAFSFAQPISNEAWMENRMLDQQKDWLRHLQEFPDDAQKLSNLKMLIPKDHCVTVGNQRLCGSQSLDGLVLYLGLRQDDKLHEFLDKAVSRDNVVDLGVVDEFTRDITFGVFADGGIAQVLISRKDMQEGLSDAQEGKVAIAALEKKGIDYNEWPITELRLNQAFENPEEQTLIGKLGPDSVDPIDLIQLGESLQRNPGLNYYVYAGKEDSFSPYEAVSAAVSKVWAVPGVHMTFKALDGGHEQFKKSRELFSDILRESLGR